LIEAKTAPEQFTRKELIDIIKNAYDYHEAAVRNGSTRDIMTVSKWMEGFEAIRNVIMADVDGKARRKPHAAYYPTRALTFHVHSSSEGNGGGDTLPVARFESERQAADCG
jgi:hypothetical protein